MQRSLPTQATERAMILDVLRGFAILGILLDNMFAFTGFGFLSMEQMQALPTWPADGVLALLELAFVHGKFYSLFSLLFGIGFSIVLDRQEQRGANALQIFYRRLFILLLIGALHLYFLWPGDILLLYALLGFVLPLFRHCTNRTLLFWAAGFILSPVLIDTVKVLFQVKTGAFMEAIGAQIDKQYGIITIADLRNHLFVPPSGWKEFWEAQQSGFFYRYGHLIESNRLPKVLGMFLMGLYAGRRGLHLHLAANKVLLRRVRKWGFIIGVPANMAMAFFEIDGKAVPAAAGLLDTAFYAIGVVPLSLAYTAAICLLWQKKEGHTKWRHLAPAGRMALTNYIMHTLLGIALFYAVGLGLGGSIGPSVFFPVAIGIFGLQVVCSNSWFRNFQYGPLEWLWRQLTYGKRLPLRRKAFPKPEQQTITTASKESVNENLV